MYLLEKINIDDSLNKSIVIGMGIYALGSTLSVVISNIGLSLCLLSWLAKKIKDKDLKIKSTLYDKYIFLFIAITAYAFMRSWNEGNSFKRFWDPILLFYIIVDFAPDFKVLKGWTQLLFMSMLFSIFYSFWQYKVGVSRVHGNIFVMEFADLLSFLGIYTVIYSIWGNTKLKNKIFFGIVALMSMISLILTKTRGGWIAFVISLVIIVLSLSKKNFILIIIVGTILLLILPHILPDIYFNRFISIFDFRNNLSNITRINLWKGAILIYRDNWLTGIGLDNFSKVIIKEPYLFKPIVTTSHAHNNFLQLATETGSLGLIAFILLFGKIIKDLYSKYKFESNINYRLFFLCTMGIVISFLIHGLTEYNLRDMFVVRLLWFMLAISCTLYNKKKNRN